MQVGKKTWVYKQIFNASGEDFHDKRCCKGVEFSASTCYVNLVLKKSYVHSSFKNIMQASWLDYRCTIGKVATILQNTPLIRKVYEGIR